MPKKSNWTKSSWREFKALQQHQFKDLDNYWNILKSLETYPPLVFSGEIERLKGKIADAGKGKNFILQGGDCAERFIDCNADTIVKKLKILLQMSLVITYGARKPVVRIGRIAGQYAKPRSSAMETIDGKTLPSYRGDIINSIEFTKEAREHDANRLMQSYLYSASTLNFIRAMMDGGFADLHNPHKWDLRDLKSTSEWKEYEQIVERIVDAVYFMDSLKVAKEEMLRMVDFYTSHEGLLLGYEEALTRKSPITGKYYNLGSHMLWIGDRTRQLDGAHVEYFRGIQNPIGIKVGPSMNPDELIELLEILNPKNEKGRITLISRFGVSKVENMLPPIIDKIKQSGNFVTWSCDPMHGNGKKTESGIKTRFFDDIETELQTSFRIHREQKTHLSGFHFELTGNDVTECIGGAIGLDQDNLTENYETYCDPRLNYAQSLEMAFLISKALEKEKQKVK